MLTRVCSYRSPEEIKEVKKKRDPIKTLEKRMIDSNVSTSDELKVSITYINCVNICMHIQSEMFMKLNF